MACPLLQICVPIDNGVSHCSPHAHQTTHHLNHQHLPHLGRIIPRLLVPLYRYNSPLNRGVLHGSGYSDLVMRGKAKNVHSTNHISPGMPRMGTLDEGRINPIARTRQDRQRGTGSQEERSGSSVQSSGLCLNGCAKDSASGPRRMARCRWNCCGPTGKRNLGHGTSLRIVTPPFTWGLLKVDREAIRPLFCLPASSSFFTSLLHPFLHCSSSAHRWIYTHGWCVTDVHFLELWQSD